MDASRAECGASLAPSGSRDRERPRHLRPRPLHPEMKKRSLAISASSAFAFVLTMGIVNLFGDVTYEGGASINGPFLGSLGASAAAISIIAGFGEFLGYSLRSVSGWIADKTGKYWSVTFVGYTINL